MLRRIVDRIRARWPAEWDAETVLFLLLAGIGLWSSRPRRRR